ncbi:MAG: hypothetical protein ACRC2N_15155 [Aeromonas sp.]
MIQNEISKIKNLLQEVYEEEKKIKKFFLLDISPVLIILLIFIFLYIYFSLTKVTIVKNLVENITLEKHYKNSKLFKDIYYNLDRTEILEIEENKSNLDIKRITKNGVSDFFLENTRLSSFQEWSLNKDIELFIKSNKLTVKVKKNNLKNEEIYFLIKGVKNGAAQILHKDGSIEIFSYKSGLKEGPAQVSYKDGSIEIFSYKSGLKEGPAQVLHRDGSVEIFSYKLGLKEGLAQISYKDGSIEIFSYKLGLKEGLAQISYKDGNIKVFQYKLNKEK